MRLKCEGFSSHLAAVFRQLFQLRAADVPLYQFCDKASGHLLLLMVVFGPWALGTTEVWTIWVMNVAAYLLGALLLVKWFIRKIKKYPAPRWTARSLGRRVKPPRMPARLATRVLGWLTLALLLYCLMHALNAAATYQADKHLFVYFPHLNWLPHSFDAHRSWFYFWMYLGLAAVFWGLRDWLLGQTAAEEKNFRQQTLPVIPAVPARMRRLIWVLAISGFALAIESIVQRLSGSTKVLFLIQPLTNPEGDTQFGPFAYRSNAAQYFNLLWPLCLGVWWRQRRRGKIYHWLPVFAAVMAVGPLMCTSRAGALVAAGMLLSFALIFLGAEFGAVLRAEKNLLHAGKYFLLTLVFLAAVIGVGLYFGWEKLSPRMDDLGGGLTLREAMYADAKPMAADYPLFGTGPGTFATVFQLYRISYETYWPEQLHNDWLETLITFGWTGFILAMAAFGCVVVTGWFAPRRIFIAAGLALAGCLVHARFDFPLQIHSVLLLFLLICAVLMTLGAMPRRMNFSEHKTSPPKPAPAA